MSPGNSESRGPTLAVLRRPAVVAAVVGLGAICWLVSGFYTVASDERGVVTRFGRPVAKVPPGIHYALPWPIDRVFTPKTTDVKRIEVGWKTRGELSSEPRRSDFLTGDENILKIMMVVQYKISDPAAYVFSTEEPQWLVERAVESAINLCAIRMKVDDVLTTAKDEIQATAIQMAQMSLDGYRAGIRLLGGNLQVVDPPVPVVDAFKEVASAKKDSERLVDEARGYEGQILPKAGGEAQQRISQAEAAAADRVQRASGDATRFLSRLDEYRRAKEVTRTRLYTESMERILSKTRLVILDAKDGQDRSNVTIVDKQER